MQILYEGKTSRDLIAFLAWGGADVVRMHREGYKSLSELWKEHGIKDVQIYYDTYIGEIVFLSLSVEFHIRAEGLELFEKWRKYPRSPKLYVRQFPRETRRRGESVIDATRRGFWEEFGFYIPLEYIEEQKGANRIAYKKESSVYPSIRSTRISQTVFINLPRLPWQGTRVCQDGKVFIGTDWEAYNSGSTTLFDPLVPRDTLVKT